MEVAMVIVVTVVVAEVMWFASVVSGCLVRGWGYGADYAVVQWLARWVGWVLLSASGVSSASRGSILISFWGALEAHVFRQIFQDVLNHFDYDTLRYLNILYYIMVRCVYVDTSPLDALPRSSKLFANKPRERERTLLCVRSCRRCGLTVVFEMRYSHSWHALQSGHTMWWEGLGSNDLQHPSAFSWGTSRCFSFPPQRRSSLGLLLLPALLALTDDLSDY